MTANSNLEKSLILILRIMMGWTFLYASSHQLFNPAFSAAGFLGNAKTFAGFYAFFASPGMLPVTNFLVMWGHFLIGVSLILGIGVRVSSSFGALLVVLYYFPRLQFPFVDGPNNFIVEYHLVYAVVLVYLGAIHAGRIWGLEDWVKHWTFVERSPVLTRLAS